MRDLSLLFILISVASCASFVSTYPVESPGYEASRQTDDRSLKNSFLNRP